MSGRRIAARRLVVVSAVMLVVSIVGVVVMLVLNAFVLDQYNAYGEVPVPGKGSLQLPAGEVTVSFHTQVIGSTSGGGLPVPRLGMTITPPAGVTDPVVTESVGGTTTVNNDAHARVWVVKVPADGSYRITTDGQVGGFISPRLAFGHGSPYGYLVWVFVASSVIALVSLIGALGWSARTRRMVGSVALPPPGPSGGAYTPTDDGIRLEQLKTLTALRDSGALTEKEFKAEKRRILDGR